MGIENQGLVVGLPNGVCPRHGTANISVDGQPTCLHCEKEMAKAQAVPVGTVTIGDPGHEAMLGLKTADKETYPDIERMPMISLTAKGKEAPPVVVKGGTLEQQVGAALAALQSCPMPKDLKAYKAVAKAVAILEKLLAPAEEN